MLEGGEGLINERCSVGYVGPGFEVVERCVRGRRERGETGGGALGESSTLAVPCSALCVVVATSSLPPLLTDGFAWSPPVGVVAAGTMAAGTIKAIYLSTIAADDDRRGPRDGKDLVLLGVQASWRVGSRRAAAALAAALVPPLTDGCPSHVRRRSARTLVHLYVRVVRADLVGITPVRMARGVCDSLCRWARQKNVDQCTGIPSYSRH